MARYDTRYRSPYRSANPRMGFDGLLDTAVETVFYPFRMFAGMVHDRYPNGGTYVGVPIQDYHYKPVNDIVKLIQTANFTKDELHRIRDYERYEHDERAEVIDAVDAQLSKQNGKAFGSVSFTVKELKDFEKEIRDARDNKIASLVLTRAIAAGANEKAVTHLKDYIAAHKP
jgi:hypothetical protein